MANLLNRYSRFNDTLPLANLYYAGYPGQNSVQSVAGHFGGYQGATQFVDHLARTQIPGTPMMPDLTTNTKSFISPRGWTTSSFAGAPYQQSAGYQQTAQHLTAAPSGPVEIPLATPAPTTESNGTVYANNGSKSISGIDSDAGKHFLSLSMGIGPSSFSIKIDNYTLVVGMIFLLLVIYLYSTSVKHPMTKIKYVMSQPSDASSSVQLPQPALQSTDAPRLATDSGVS